MAKLTELLTLQPDMAPDRKVEFLWVLSKMKSPALVLDVGCGGSIIAKYLSNHGFDVTAADIDPAAGLYWNGEVRSNFVLIDCRYPLWTNRFDYVLIISTLEHLDWRDAVLMVNGLGRSLKVGGRMFITVPYGEGPMKVGVHIEKGYNKENMTMLLSPETRVASSTVFTKKQIGWDAKDIFCIELERANEGELPKRLFSIELKTWPGGTIPFMARAVSDEDAKLQGQNFLLPRRWKGRVGKVKCLEPASQVSIYGAKTHV